MKIIELLNPHLDNFQVSNNSSSQGVLKVSPILKQLPQRPINLKCFFEIKNHNKMERNLGLGSVLSFSILAFKITLNLYSVRSFTIKRI